MSGIWDFIAVYDRGDGREELVPNFFNFMVTELSMVNRPPTMSELRSPFVLLKKRLGINFFDDSFDEDINAIVKQSFQFAIDIGAYPIINGLMVKTPELLDDDSIYKAFPKQGKYFYEYGVKPEDLKFFNYYYSWYEVFKTPVSGTIGVVDDNAKLNNHINYVSALGSFSLWPAYELLLPDFDPPAETQLNVPDYYRTLEDLLVLMDELCYVNAKIYFDSPDSGYVTNQFAQRKGELQWRIQSLLEDRMNIGYGPVEPSVIP